jgi:hypothetical protein
MKEKFLKTVMEGAGIGRMKAEYLWDIGLRQPAEQHQGEPVSWFRDGDDGREYCEKPFTTDWVPLYTHADPGEVERLRGIIRMHEKTVREQADHLAYMRAQPAEQHQFEPVAYADPKSFENFKAMAHLGGLYLHEWMWAEPKPGLVPLYTHADPGDVERLREQIKEWQETSVHWTHKCDTLRAQLAERDTLLREAIEDDVGEYILGATWHSRARAVLSASAEPSAPDCDHCAGAGHDYYGEKCDHCKRPAPVERDERAAFEAAYAAEFSEVRGTPYTAADVASMRNGDWYGDRPFLNGQWAGWQARAALERKP